MVQVSGSGGERGARVYRRRMKIDLKIQRRAAVTGKKEEGGDEDRSIEISIWLFSLFSLSLPFSPHMCGIAIERLFLEYKCEASEGEWER
jgi:hypothetical protein